jgi:HEPN domain-containing protein
MSIRRRIEAITKARIVRRGPDSNFRRHWYSRSSALRSITVITHHNHSKTGGASSKLTFASYKRRDAQVCLAPAPRLLKLDLIARVTGS